jgi:uncharacterized protein (DUF1501 family)
MANLFDCEGNISLTRRGFLKATAVLTFAALPELSFGAGPSSTRLLVILLRGGLDGLFAMPPVGDPQLKGLRRHINPDGVTKLDGFFALHPAFQNIASLYHKGEALLVHGTSIPYQGRSHFEGQDVMESGAMQPFTSRTGWLGRALDLQGYRSVAMSLPVPLILRGAGARDSDYPSWLGSLPADIYSLLKPLWVSDPDLAAAGQQLNDDRVDLAKPPDHYIGDVNTIQILARAAGERLRQGIGPRVAVLDHVGFDTHANEPNDSSRHMQEVDQAIGEFRDAIGEEVWKDTLVVTVTEFGRTAAENGSFGTDHGWATSIFVMGGKLKKGGIVADWPGLKPKNLFEGRDVMATIDARSLYGAVLTSALQVDPELVRRQVLDHTPSRLFEEFL